ncbi:hypothetical protein [Nocardia fusca]|uniref:hypothetical protein n=1 Tax=Nocardia fusca TaxID=941183 RepID=UPI0007A755A6|nr:hypothetical protein [Nocardia fusca]
MRSRINTVVAAVSIAAAGVGIAAGTASAAPVQLTPAAPVATDPGTGAATGSADQLAQILQLLQTGSSTDAGGPL